MRAVESTMTRRRHLVSCLAGPPLYVMFLLTSANVTASPRHSWGVSYGGHWPYQTNPIRAHSSVLSMAMNRYFVCSSDEEELNQQYELSSIVSQPSTEGASGLANDSAPSQCSSTPTEGSAEPVCVCRCLGTLHGPTCYITRGGVRALVEATAGIFSRNTGRSVCTRTVLGALGVTALGATAGALTYYSLTTSGMSEELSSAAQLELEHAAEQVSVSDLPVIHASSDGEASSTSTPWFDQYE